MLLTAAQLSSACIVLLLVCMQATPLLWACTSGSRVVGAEFALPAASCYALARRWAESMLPGAGSVTFLGARHAVGKALIYVSPTAFAPPPAAVARTPAARRRLAASGVQMAWMSAKALAGVAIFDVAAHALFACSALRGPMGDLPDGALPGTDATFRFGVTAVRSLVERPAHLPTEPTPLESAMGRCFQEARYLNDLLMSDDSVDCDYLAGWAAQIRPPELSEFPAAVLGSLPTFAAAHFDSVAMPAIAAPPTLAWLERKPRQAPPPSVLCPRRASDLMPRWQWRRVQRWLGRHLADLECIRDQGADCERSRPPVIAVGQGVLHEWARGVVWDFRQSPLECATPLDFHAPLEHTLNVPYFQRRLSNYPNQQILSFISEGVRPLADVELQTVLAPHLLSLAGGFKSVVKELNRMSAPELGWYSRHADFPFWPMYSLSEGAVPRKLEDRWRRCEEGGAPRNDCFDDGGVRALSINEASMTHHFPQHYASDHREDWLQYLAHRKLPPTAEMVEALNHPASRGTKWHRQRMPGLSDAMRCLVVLKRAAHLTRDAIYVIGDDVKDYFNHLVNAAEDLWMMNTIFLNEDDIANHVDQPAYASKHGSLVFVHEKRMGFGLHPNSNIAQDLSEALMHMLRSDIDAIDDPLLESDPREAVQRWLSQRRIIEGRTGRHERRMYCALMYCDDSILIIVGAARAKRVLRIWRRLISDAGLIMAIPEKRTVGVWCTWIGALIFAGLGVVAIPRTKVLRASHTMRRLCNEGLEFSEYRSLVGLLEHFRCIARVPKHAMHSLYRPHGRDGEGTQGPNTLVRPSAFMSTQIRNWLHRLAQCAGCAVTAVLRRAEIATGAVTTFFTASDAATDSAPPGLGGFMHGYYWQMEVLQEHLQWLHITVLELLACAFNLIIHSRLLPPRARMLQLVDASTTFYALTNESERSEIMMYAHHRLLRTPAFEHAAEQADLTHGSGDANIAGDAASRSLKERLRSLSAALRVRLTRLPVPEVCLGLYNDVLAFARQRGIRIRDPRPPPPLPLPPDARKFIEWIEKGLGKRRRDREDGDGPPSALARLLARKAAGDSAGPGPVRQTAPTVAPSEKPRTSGLARLLSRRGQPAPQCLLTSHRSAVVGGQMLAVPQFERTTEHNVERRELRLSAVARSIVDRAHLMAAPGATPAQVEAIRAGLQNASDMAQLGAADLTLVKDDLAWEHWVAFCAAYGWDPVVLRHTAVAFPDLLASRLGLFLLWVYPRIRGRGRADAHPRSVLNNYPGAIARILSRDHKIPVPRAKTYEAEAKGLLRGYKRIYGTLALAPKRRQPMRRSIWNKVLALAPGDVLAGRSPWMHSAHIDKVGKRLGNVLTETGHRLGEIVSYSPDEINYLTRHCVTLRRGATLLVDPTVQQWRSMCRGDVVFLAPCAGV